MAATIWLLAIGGLAAVFVSGFLVLRRRGAVTQPACGKCGYPVEGMSTFNCPECGSDVRQVGIVTPGTARSVPVFPALALAWMLVLAVAAPAVTRMVAGVTPNASLLQQQRTIFMQASYLNVTLQAMEEAFTTGYVTQPQPAERLTVTLSNNAPGPVLRVDRPSGAWELEHNGVGNPAAGRSGRTRCVSS